MQDRFRPAIDEYQNAIALDPNSPAALNHLARAKILIGAPAEAIPLLEQYLRINPRYPNVGLVYYRLGLAHVLLGHTDEAIRWYQKTGPRFYACPACMYLELAGALGLKGDTAAAQAAFAEFRRTARFGHQNDTTIARLKRWLDQDSKDPAYLAMRERTIYKGLRKIGVPEE